MGRQHNLPKKSPQRDEVQFPVHIGEVRMRDGTMDYSDRSLVAVRHARHKPGGTAADSAPSAIAAPPCSSTSAISVRSRSTVA